MLAPVDDPQLQTLLHRLYTASDVPAFWAAVKSLLNEAMPHPRSPTIRERALLRALHPHVEARARQVTARELGADTDPRRVAYRIEVSEAEVQAQLYQLTPAERDIVELLREGWSNKEIACQLEKSIRTVKTQLTSVYKKFEVRSRSKLLAKLP
jgi:DNA-binding NarL/FixJ family response regulator